MQLAGSASVRFISVPTFQLRTGRRCLILLNSAKHAPRLEAHRRDPLRGGLWPNQTFTSSIGTYRIARQATSLSQLVDVNNFQPYQTA